MSTTAEELLFDTKLLKMFCNIGQTKFIREKGVDVGRKACFGSYPSSGLGFGCQGAKG